MDEQTPAAPVPGVRVASLPYADPYVEAVLPPGAVRIGPAVGSPWLDPTSLAAHAEDADVLHVHLGAGGPPVTDPGCWAEAVRRSGVPLVVTVHQLAGDGLAPVLETAEVVLTLTPGAADEIAERSGRTAIVVAHPSIAVPVPGLGAERGLAGLVLREAPDPAGLVRAALSGAVSGGGRLRVLAPPGAVPPGVRALADDGDVELVEVAADGPARAAALQELHVAVLPERGRTHSRDLEVCRDVGTRVVAPGGGRFAEQWSDVVTYEDGDADGEGGLDAVSLTAAVAAALTRPAPRPADRAWRDEQRAAVQRVHAQVYASVAGDRLRV